MPGRSTSRRGRHSLSLREVGGWELVDVIREKFPLVSDASNIWDRAPCVFLHPLASTPQFCHPCSMRFQLGTLSFQVLGVGLCRMLHRHLIISVLRSGVSLAPWYRGGSQSPERGSHVPKDTCRGTCWSWDAVCLSATLEAGMGFTPRSGVWQDGPHSKRENSSGELGRGQA